MTRRITSAVILLLAVSSLAADSNLKSKEDYYFVNVPSNAIKGVVMGEDIGHGAMRFEDILFLHEALLERQNMITCRRNEEFLSASNAYEVVPSISMRSLPNPLDLYSPPENVLITYPKLIEISPSSRVEYAYSYRIPNWITEPFTKKDVLVQTISNRTDRFEVSLNRGRDIYHTDVVTNESTHVGVDDWMLCYENTNAVKWESSYPVLTSGRNLYMRFKSLDIGMNRTIKDVPTYSAQQIRNLYTIVRACKKTIPEMVSASVTNKLNATHRISTGYTNIIEYVTSLSYSINNSHNIVTIHRQYQTADGEFEDYGDQPQTSQGYTRESTTYDSIVFMLNTPHPIAADTAGTDVPRFGEKAYAFAKVYFTLSELKTSEATGHDAEVSETNITASVMIPIDATRIEGTNVTYCVEINDAAQFFSKAASEAKINAPQIDTLPRLPAALTPEWGTGMVDQYLGRVKEHIESASVAFSAEIISWYLVYDIYPKTFLEDWDEYYQGAEQ